MPETKLPEVRLAVGIDRFPIRGHFTIARGSKTVAEVVTVALETEAARGWAEAVPYARYGESLDSVLAQIEAVRPALEAGGGRAAIASLLPAGAARNAIDCALWDLEAKTTGKPAWQLAGVDAPVPVETAYTLSLDTPDAMADAARAAIARGHALLKLKLGGEADLDRLRAVRAAAPDTRLIVDANEGWTADVLTRLAPRCAELGVVLIEQPLPAGADAVLVRGASPVPLCADESCHVAADVAALAGRYDAVNIKLDKAGGLTEALRLADAARSADMRIMVGCMVGSSLAMAPALLLARTAQFVDLDGPLLLAEERVTGLTYQKGKVFPSPPALWG
ncbi:N-acetyl-D-Glu racemase DgcA [Parapedomonas caeni]|jgi:L-alanine-DL-glutamate epimerase-like enolase superfamily enzyme